MKTRQTTRREAAGATAENFIDTLIASHAGRAPGNEINFPPLFRSVGLHSSNGDPCLREIYFTVQNRLPDIPHTPVYAQFENSEPEE